MSTRATYEFSDERESFTIYKHCDGYPKGGLQWIAKAVSLAWPLPRFEASDFGSAFVAANKDRAGDVHLATGRDDHGDTAFHYVVTARDGILHVSIHKANRDWKAHTCEWELQDEGPLDALLMKFAA